jgi:two-component system response regulator RegA
MTERKLVRSMLIVDNDPVYLRSLTRWMRRPDRIVWAVSNMNEAFDVACSELLDVAIIDFLLDRGVGTDIIRAFRAAHPELPLVLITSNLTPAIDEDARHAGAHLAFDKCDVAKILPAVEAGCVAPPREPEPQPDTLAQSEWKHLTRVFVDCRYNKSETARRLDISRITLLRKLRDVPRKRPRVAPTDR